MSARFCDAVGANSFIRLNSKSASYSFRGTTTKSSFWANFLGIVSVFMYSYDNKNRQIMQHIGGGGQKPEKLIGKSACIEELK